MARGLPKTCGPKAESRKLRAESAAASRSYQAQRRAVIDGFNNYLGTEVTCGLQRLL